MSKEIVVRKPTAQRLGICAIFLLIVCTSIVLTVSLYPIYQFGLLSLIGALPVGCIFLYYETWRVTLASESITITCVFMRTKKYSYPQIIDAYVTRSYSMRQHLCLKFSDGKRIKFQTDLENVGKAKRKIQMHHSIRILEL